MPERKIATTVVILSLLTTLFLYWPGLNGPFVFDDYTNTVHLQLKSLSPESLLDLALSDDAGRLRRPVSVLSLGLNNYFSGLDPFAFKLTNLVIHVLCGLVLLLLSTVVIRHLGNRLGKRHNYLIAATTTFIWMVHPLQVSSVLYVVQRMVELSALFTALALTGYCLARVHLNEGRLKPFAAYSAGYLICFVLAVLSKENGILIPFYAGLIEWLVFRFKTTNQSEKKWLKGFLTLLIALPVLGGISYFLANLETFLSGYTLRPFNLEQRLLTESEAIWFYLKLIFLPQLHDMSLYHDDFGIVTNIDMLSIASITGLAGLLSVGLYLHKKAPVVTFGVMWFFFGHLLESTLLPLELVFEHRNYLPMFGPLFAISYYAVRGLEGLERRPRVAGTTASLAGVFILLFLTAMRVDSWSTREKLVFTMYQNHPRSTRVNIERANIDLLQNRVSKATKFLDQAQKLSPWDSGIAVTGLIAKCQTNHIDEKEFHAVLDHIRKARWPGQLFSAILNLADKSLRNKCAPIDSLRLLAIVDTIIGNKNVLPTQKHLFTAYMVRGRVLTNLGRLQLAAQAYITAYRAQPDNLLPLFELAYVQLNNGLLADARKTVALLDQAQSRRLINREQDKVEELEKYLRQSNLEASEKAGVSS